MPDGGGIPLLARIDRHSVKNIASDLTHTVQIPDIAIFSRYPPIFFYSARNARIASAVLATAIPSVRLPVCLLSVTRRYCVKTTARSTVQFALSDSKMCLVL